MKFALIGYGKMGQSIERIALERGHSIVSVIDIGDEAEFTSQAFRSADVAIEFTTPSAAVDNYKRAFAAGLPVVSGTTGWLEDIDEVRRLCDEGGHTFFYASNFSLGVNIFFDLNRYLSGKMNRFPEYDVSVTELHHKHKKDAPSGTAITLAEQIIENVDRKLRWTLEEEATEPTDLGVWVMREGEVPGTHEVEYESPEDTITISHSAKSRHGFALGAVKAAEFTVGRRGFLGMKDMLEL
ncbi:MAG: 4-hydroxy-tetrahydrodipicolinate reductase [Tannerellaceae bacterium]|jgi:4-hydroxy-tetrahydrodipicolinate reductase|nr:4-hydroxy-tetrahydrodipicolinate reductase [Tannerellaceae bacterium]